METPSLQGIVAVVLAAGMSRRMGRPKMLLPWGRRTVIGQVVSVLREAGLEQILVVTGSDREALQTTLEGSAISLVYNPDYPNGEMLVSIQTGLQAIPTGNEWALVALGDQPQMQVETVHGILETVAGSNSGLVLPSYHNRRGHPWLIHARYWPEILSMQAPATMRDFFALHSNEIHYLPVSNHTIMQDLDTPQDYESSRPT